MTNMIAAAISWLGEKRDAHLSDTVTFTRTTGGTLTLTAMQTANDYLVTDADGQDVTAKVMEFVIASTAFAGEYPVEGDTITISSGDVYRVANLNDSPWRWADAFKMALRIHTKQMGDQ